MTPAAVPRKAGHALGIGTNCLLLGEPFEGIAPALAERLSEALASLKRKDLP